MGSQKSNPSSESLSVQLHRQEFVYVNSLDMTCGRCCRTCNTKSVLIKVMQFEDLSKDIGSY